MIESFAGGGMGNEQLRWACELEAAVNQLRRAVVKAAERDRRFNDVNWVHYYGLTTTPTSQGSDSSVSCLSDP